MGNVLCCGAPRDLSSEPHPTTAGQPSFVPKLAVGEARTGGADEPLMHAPRDDGAIGGALSAEDIAFFTAGSSHVPGTPSSNLTLREQEMSAALRIAVSLHSRGDLEGAASGYKSVLNTATDLSTRAQDVRLFERAPLQRVMNRYRGRALMGLALIYSKRGNNDEALRAITSALELFKAHVDIANAAYCAHKQLALAEAGNRPARANVSAFVDWLGAHATPGADALRRELKERLAAGA